MSQVIERKYRYFPGWTMLGISAAAQFMSAPGQSYSVSAFKDPMRQTLEVSETSYALAYGFATIVSGLLLPWVGRLTDRYGARRVLSVVALLLGLGCLSMSQVSGTLRAVPGFQLGAVARAGSALADLRLDCRRVVCPAARICHGCIRTRRQRFHHVFPAAEYLDDSRVRLAAGVDGAGRNGLGDSADSHHSCCCEVARKNWDCIRMESRRLNLMMKMMPPRPMLPTAR